MNDFGVNITGGHGVVKPRSFTLPAKPTIKDLTFVIESGPGCSPEVGTARKVKGHWLSDNMPDTISSHDFSYVTIGSEKVQRTAEETLDVQPVKLPSENVEVKAAKPRGRTAWKPKKEQ